MTDIQLDALQQRAVELGIDTDKRITYVTGPAGTGKTTIMKQVYNAFVDAGYSVALCAPTGKAARRISEATGIEACTIHRLLEYPHPGERDENGKPLRTTEPKRDSANPLDYQVVLCDEYAMVATDVHRNLVDALPRGGLLRCFGDINQLAPIEKGKLDQQPDYKSPFATIIDKFDGVRLTNIHRQGEGSGIVYNAALILAGRIPARKDDFSMHVTDATQDALRKFVLENDIDFMSLDNQIIVPQRVRNTGSNLLNKQLQDLLNPSRKRVKLERYKWCKEDEQVAIDVGDKVIWTDNNYDLEIMNGETGIVENVDEFGIIDIRFSDRNVLVPPVALTLDKNGEEVEYNPQRSLELAYVLTTHKTQGSEFQNVVYAINKAASFNLCRANFYTAVTRARKRVHVITDQRAMTIAVTRTTTPKY